MRSAELSQLRNSNVQQGLAWGVAARVVHLGAGLLVARLIISTRGAESWGLVALVALVLEVALSFDFSTQDVAAYEVAGASDVANAKQRLNQVMTLASFTALAGGLVLAAGAALTSEPAFFLSAAATVLLMVPGNVYAGTLEGLGWLRELNLVVLLTALVDAVVVGLCVWFDVPLLGLVWARVLRGAVRLGLLLVLVKLRGLMVARPEPLRDARRLLSYALAYTVSRGVGMALYKSPVGLAPLVAPLAQVGALDAADQLACLAYRSSHLMYETLFNRFVFAFRTLATERERAWGKLTWEAATVGLAALLLPCAVGLAALAQPLLHAWLGQRLEVAEAALPALTLAWTVNAAGGLSTCVLMATNRPRVSVVLHLGSGLMMLGSTFALSSHGVMAPVFAILLTNLVMTSSLVLAANAVVSRSAPVLARLVVSWALVAGLMMTLEAAPDFGARAALVVLAGLAGVALAASSGAVRTVLRRPASGHAS